MTSSGSGPTSEQQCSFVLAWPASAAVDRAAGAAPVVVAGRLHADLALDPRPSSLSRSHANQTLWSTQMPSGRWYPSVATLPDGRVLVVGGVNDSGKAG